MKKSRDGQVLMEILIASVIFIFVSLSIATITSVSLRAVPQSRIGIAGAFLAKEEIEALRAVAREDWHTLSGLTLGSVYYTTTTATSSWAVAPTGKENVTLNNLIYERWFILSAVYRSTSTGDIVLSGGYYDPSTFFATVTVSSTDARGTNDVQTQTLYVSRFLNNVYTQTNWATGPVGEVVTTNTTTTFATSSLIDYTTTAGSLKLTCDGGGCGPPIDYVAYWKFDEGSGTAVNDESSNNNDGTLSTSTGWATGKSGQAVNFNAVAMTVANNASLQITGNMTLSFVAKLPQPLSQGDPWAWRKGTNIAPGYCGEAGGDICEFNLRFVSNPGAVANGYIYSISTSTWGIVGESLAGGIYREWLSPATSGLQWGDWHLVTITRSTSTGGTLYEDNATSIYAGGFWAGTASSSAGAFVLGSFGLGASTPIDEVRVYNRVLSTSEIQAIYSSMF